MFHVVGIFDRLSCVRVFVLVFEYSRVIFIHRYVLFVRVVTHTVGCYSIGSVMRSFFLWIAVRGMYTIVVILLGKECSVGVVVPVFISFNRD